MKSRRTIIIFTVGIVFLLMVLFFSNNNAKKNSEVFSNANINGVLSYVNSGTGGASIFKIENIPAKYIFLSVQDSINDNTTFHDVAEIGDKVIKKKDALYLILVKKNNKTYQYKYKLIY
jgi:hypothetical protein